MGDGTVNDALQRYLEAASGLTQVTAKKAERIVKNLVRSGEAAGDQVGDLVDDLLERSGRNREAITAMVKAESTRAVRGMGLATSKELDRLQKQVADLKRTLTRSQRDGEATGSTTDAAPTAPAKKTAAKKTAAKKTAAKKTAAKKTAAKKTAAKKTAAKKTGAKKTAAKKTGAKKTAAKKTGAKKTGAKKTAAKKTAAKKTAAKKTAAKKTAAKKTAARTTATADPVRNAAAEVRNDRPGATDAPPEASPVLAETIDQVTADRDTSS